jgi:hypothetical protein
MALPSMHRTYFIVAPSRSYNVSSCAFESIYDTGGGEKRKKKKERPVNPYVRQQRYISFCLAVLLFPTIAWKAIQVWCSVIIGVPIINMIEGHGVMVSP